MECAVCEKPLDGENAIKIPASQMSSCAYCFKESGASYADFLKKKAIKGIIIASVQLVLWIIGIVLLFVSGGLKPVFNLDFGGDKAELRLLGLLLAGLSGLAWAMSAGKKANQRNDEVFGRTYEFTEDGKLVRSGQDIFIALFIRLFYLAIGFVLGFIITAYSIIKKTNQVIVNFKGIKETNKILEELSKDDSIQKYEKPADEMSQEKTASDFSSNTSTQASKEDAPPKEKSFFIGIISALVLSIALPGIGTLVAIGLGLGSRKKEPKFAKGIGAIILLIGLLGLAVNLAAPMGILPSLPPVMNIIFGVVAAICLTLGIMLLRSKKKTK